MRRIDHLNGLKAWWNKYAKPEYKTSLSANELKAECYSEWENTGSVEMSRFKSKDERTHNFYGNNYYS